jgi:cysteine desulfurase family protein (TIGR01976 family)
MTFPIEAVRAHFPALTVEDEGRPRIYFDAPGGTQVCAEAIDAISAHLRAGTANLGGSFATSAECGALSREAHAAAADLIGGHADEIAFGPNMTSLTFALSRALSQSWQAGDEIVLTRLDHDANITPWVLAARDRDVSVRWLDIDVVTGELRIDDLSGILSPRTKLVAFGAASNALGTLNDVAGITEIVRHGSDALTFVDAVQSVPHVPTDVSALGCDFLACSPYKFFGPHMGMVWGRTTRMEDVAAYKVRPATNHPAALRFETGTPSFEAQAGLIGTIDYLAWLGRDSSAAPVERRAALRAAMTACADYETILMSRLIDGLSSIAGLSLYGPQGAERRVPTFAFTFAGHAPQTVAAHLGAHGIHAWAGHFYAVEVVRRLGLDASGGLIRVGLCHYNTAAEVDRLIEVLTELAHQ